ncbi:MAG: cyclic nucleotide-binding domain-containing protein, partial [Chloroflexota bacterium]
FMSLSNEAILPFLQSMQLFSDLSEENILEIADRLERVDSAAGEEIIKQGQHANRFYLLYQGSVKVWHKIKGEEIELAILEPGDKFGEEAFIFNRAQPAYVTSLDGCTFLTLNRENFGWLLRKYPDIKLSLKVIAESHQEARKQRFNWLHSGEVIHLISRRHPVTLWIDLFKPFFAILAAIFLLFVLRQVPGLSTLSIYFGGLLLVTSVLWVIWEILDWQNDFFIITNERVIWLERIIFQSASRQESPLSAIQSVNVQTNQLGRIFDFGDVKVRTFTGMGSLVLTNVDKPKHFHDLIEELLLRIRSKTDEAQSQRIRQSIRQSLGLKFEEPANTNIGVLEPDDVPEKKFSLFRTREITGDTITYHKHWYALIGNLFTPLFIFISGLGIISWFVYRDYVSITPVYPALFTVITIGVPALLVVFLWCVYLVADWNNDLYRITYDNIMDSDKKPFGQEISKSAPIANIQSMQHSRKGLLRILLNFGTVTISVADAELNFVDVHNPSQVQQDIFYRQERLKFDTDEAKNERESSRMGEWLKTYHEVWTEEQEANNKQLENDQSGDISG